MTEEAAMRRLVEENNFGLLVSAGPDGGFHATHLPWLWDDSDGGTELLAHMARANPHWRHLNGQEALVVFTGPHCYISPAWYEAGIEVPTWDYTAVHVTGRARLLEPEELARQVERLVRFHEPASTLLEHLNAPEVAVQRQAIVGVAVRVDRIEGKAKLSQNRPAIQRERVVRVLEQSPREHERAIAKLIRGTLGGGQAES
jgi:transcriptional regulator